MAITHDFNESLEKAQKYEEKIIEYFDNISEIEDVRDEEDFQFDDIDFLDITNNIKYEIKIDFQGHKTKNIAYETISRKVGFNIVGKGCFAKTKADIILYHYAETGKTLFLDIKKLRKEVGLLAANGELVAHNIQNATTNGKMYYGQVLLVPEDKLKKSIMKIENYNFEIIDDTNLINEDNLKAIENISLEDIIL